MANNVTNTLIANITSTEDTSSNVPINRSLGNPSYDSSSGLFTTYRALVPGATLIGVSPTAGIAAASQVYVKNLDTANPIVVAWVPAGGASNPVITLYPGDLILFWCKPGNANTGITNNLSLTNGAAVNVIVEYFIGG